MGVYEANTNGDGGRACPFGVCDGSGYTIDENEKNTYIKDYPDLCTYQGIAWYADKPGGTSASRDAEKDAKK